MEIKVVEVEKMQKVWLCKTYVQLGSCKLGS